jgi:hypothetical protein
MDVAFLMVVFAQLAGLARDVAVDISAAALYDKISQRDLYSLIESCLDEAVKNITKGDHKGGGRLQPHLDRAKLRQLLEQNPAIAPLPPIGSVDMWTPYLHSFKEVIVSPGTQLRDEEHLDLIRTVLDEGAKSFNSKLPSAHPAFEQILLQYAKKQSNEHNQILEGLNAVPARTVEALKRTQTSAQGADLATLSTEWGNPFSVVAADDLDLRSPDHIRQIRTLFISRYTDLPTMRKRFHTLLEGQRGTGKTMIMKFLAFQTQILEWTEKEGRPPADFLKAPSNFIGVYSKLGQGVFDKSDFEAIDDQVRRERIFEHRLALHLFYDILETMKSVFRYAPPEAEQLRRIRYALQSYLQTNGMLDSITGSEDLLQKAQDYIQVRLVQKVDEYLGSVSPGGGPPIDFNPWLTLSGQLVPFLRLLREASSAAVPFFLMLDDFDVLDGYQQGRVFRTAANREFDTVCFKFGVMILGQKTVLSGPERTFRPGDDYDAIDLDWTQGGLHDDYETAVLDIAAARLAEAAGWPKALQDLLQAWPRGETILREVKAQMEREWDEAAKKPTDSRSDYLSKYLNARFFQTLRRSKVRPRYAGLGHVTMVSSGIFRQFLEACKLIFDRAHDSGWTPSQGDVRPELQDLAIREYSDQMMQEFSRTSGDTQALLSGDIEITSAHMTRLIDSLCDVFYARLHSQDYKGDPEIICFAVKDDLAQAAEASTILKVAVRESILHRFQYSPKTAGGPPLPAYMLNRRLGPRRDLSITRMQGRIEIESGDIVLAATDRRAFFQKIMKKIIVESGGGDSSQYPMDLPAEGDK